MYILKMNEAGEILDKFLLQEPLVSEKGFVRNRIYQAALVNTSNFQYGYFWKMDDGSVFVPRVDSTNVIKKKVYVYSEEHILVTTYESIVETYTKEGIGRARLESLLISGKFYKGLRYSKDQLLTNYETNHQLSTTN